MNIEWIAFASAVWFGILTSISPCPLATNIAAISYIGRRVDSTKMVLLSGLLYTLGRTIAYWIIGVFVIKGLLSIPGVSMFLQQYFNKILGPILILLGLLLLDIISLGFKGTGVSEANQKKIDAMGIWGALVLGFLFAMAFCPTSAGLFFGGLVPAAIKADSIILFPMLYGIGTALPVIIFSFIIAFATQMVGKLFNILTIIDKWVRRITAIIFILAGIYMVMTYIFNIYIFS